MKKYDVTLTVPITERPFPSMRKAPNRQRKRQKLSCSIPTLSTLQMMILSAAKPILPSRARTVLTVRARIHYRKMRIVRTVRTSAPCAVSVCMRTTAKNEMSYQALNLVSQIRLLGGIPLIPRENRKEFKNE